MGDLIQLSERIADRSRPAGELPRFFFALDDPLSYLAAERVERALGPIDWVPVLGPLSELAGTGSADERELLARQRMALAEREAGHLDLPLVEPHRFPMKTRGATRAATFAAEAGNGCPFALALMRLTFCGGFDIASAPVIAEAAAVAGLNPAEAVKAAGEERYDLQIDATSHGLTMRGIDSPPAISVGTHWFEGPSAVIAAMAYTAARGMVDEPLLPAG